MNFKRCMYVQPRSPTCLGYVRDLTFRTPAPYVLFIYYYYIWHGKFLCALNVGGEVPFKRKVYVLCWHAFCGLIY